MNLISAWMSNYTYCKVWDEITYLPQLKRCSHWSLRIDKQFHHILCWTRNYLSILGFKFIHISESKRDPWPLTFHYFCIRNYLSTQPSQYHVPHANQVFGGYMMTSSNGNIFRVTGHLCGEFTGNSPVPGEFPAQRSVTRSFDVFFDLRLNKRLSKQSWGWWFETLSCPLWRHCNETLFFTDMTNLRIRYCI